jgi:hypothetical protein
MNANGETKRDMLEVSDLLKSVIFTGLDSCEELVRSKHRLFVIGKTYQDPFKMHVSFEVATTKLNCKECHFFVALQTMQETAAFSHLFKVFETKKLARGSFSGPSQDKVRGVDFKADELDLESLHKKALQACSFSGPSQDKVCGVDFKADELDLESLRKKALQACSFSGPSQGKVRGVDFKADELNLESLHKKALQASSPGPSTPKLSASAAASSP